MEKFAHWMITLVKTLAFSFRQTRCMAYCAPHEFRNSLAMHIQMPVYSIATTTGFDGSAVAWKLLDEDKPNLGFESSDDRALFLCRRCSCMSIIVEKRSEFTNTIHCFDCILSEIVWKVITYQDLVPRFWLIMMVALKGTEENLDSVTGGNSKRGIQAHDCFCWKNDFEFLLSYWFIFCWVNIHLILIF